MNCEYVRDNLSAYLDKEADRPLAVSIEAHLRECDACRSYCKMLRRASELMDVWEEAEPPALFTRSVMEQVRPKKRLSWMRVLLPAAAVIVVTVSVFLIYGGKGHRKTEVVRSAPVTMAESKDIVRDKRAAADSDVNEDEIIANLQMFQDKDFYDSIKAMKELDYLPLMDDHSGHKGDANTSSLEYVTA